MAESPPPSRGAPALAGFLIAAVVAAVPALLPASPWNLLPLLLALPLQLAGAAWALGHRPEPTLLAALRARAWVSATWLFAAFGLLVALLAWPALQLLSSPTLGATLLASVAVGLAGLAIWRAWPAPLLPLVELPAQRAALRPLRALAAGRALAQSDPSAARGLLASVVLLLLLLGTLALGLGGEWLGAATRAAVYLGWAAVLSPFLAFVLVALVEPARLASARTPVGDAPTPLSARAADAELVLPAGLDPTARLYATARTGRVEPALAELESGADPHALPDPYQRDQRTLPMLAAVLGDLRLLRALISRGVDLNRRHAGLTALLAATRDSLHGRPEAVMTLLANGADPRVADAEGRTPLHFAALLAEPEVAALLLDANADIDACNRDGYSPLGVACAAGNWRMARFLLERRAQAEPAGGQPALLAAAGGEDDPAGVQLMLKHKARVDARGRLGRSALMNACLAGNARIVDALLTAGADANAADEHGVTPLLEAARAGADAAITRLAKAAPDPAARDHSGRNALMLACQSAQSGPATIDALLALGVDPQQAADDGRRALDLAVAHGRWPLVARLDPGHALPAAHERHAASAPADTPDALLRPWDERLREAALDGDLAAMDALLRRRPEGVALDALYDALQPRLALPALRRLAQLLDADALDDHGRRRWLRSLDAADGVAIEAMLARGASPGGNAGLARWAAACLRAQQRDAAAETLALAMLDAGADAFGAWQGATPLTLAARLGWSTLLRALLERGADPQATDAQRESALAIAIKRRWSAALPALLRHGARIESPLPDGRTPRGLALASGDPELIDWLDWRGWRLPERPLRPADLVAAAAAGDRDAVRRLLRLGLPVDACDAQGASALLRAAGSGHAAIVGDLLDAGADPARAAASGATPLTAAVSRRQLGVIDVLLARGVAADQPLAGAVTPLMVAAALGLADVCKVLLAAGADPRAVDQQGNGVLHALAQGGFAARPAAPMLATWRCLLGAGADADARNADGLSPLLLLLGCRVEAGASADEDGLAAQLELLLERKVALDVRDARGATPLHLAALHGQLKVARRLLAAGADREARDALGRRPQEIAVMRGFVDIARELAPANAAPPSLARLLRDPSR